MDAVWIKAAQDMFDFWRYPVLAFISTIDQHFRSYLSAAMTRPFYLHKIASMPWKADLFSYLHSGKLAWIIEIAGLKIGWLLAQAGEFFLPIYLGLPKVSYPSLDMSPVGRPPVVTVADLVLAAGLLRWSLPGTDRHCEGLAEDRSRGNHNSQRVGNE